MRVAKALLYLAGLLGSALPCTAQTFDYSVYIDSDNNAATGCTVATGAGSIAGVETVLTAHVAMDPVSVTGQSLQHCNGGSLGPATSLGSGYPVGFDLGPDALDVIELGAPLGAFGTTQPSWRLVFGARSPLLGGEDLTQSVLAPNIGWIPLSPSLIPTVSPLLLGLLAVVLGAGAVSTLRRRPHLLGLVLVASSLGISGLAWAAWHALDGQIGDWTTTPLVTDAADDASADEPPIDIRQAFAAGDGQQVQFRIDVSEIRLSELLPDWLDNHFQIAENSTDGTLLGPVRTSASGLASLLQLAQTMQQPAIGFAFDPVGTQLSVADSTVLDYETHPTFQLQLAATLTGVPGFTRPVTVDVALLDVNEAPTLAAQAFSVSEHATNGTALGTVAAQDPDAGIHGQLTFAILGGSGASVFALDATSGALSLADAAALSLAASPYTLDVQVSDGGTPPLSAAATLSVAVQDENDPPIAIGLAPSSVMENAPVGTLIGTLTTSDADTADTHVYSLSTGCVVPGTDNSSVTIMGNTLVTAAVLDHETRPTLSICLRSTDNGGLHVDQSLGVDVEDVDDAPVAVADTATLTEDAPATGIDVLINDTDQDGGPIAVASVTQAAHGAVALTGGVVTYRPDANYCNTPDGNPDTFTYTLSPGDSMATVQVSVTCVNDAPILTLPGPQSLPGGSTLVFGTASGNALGVDDVDAGSALLLLNLTVDAGTLTLTQTGALASLTGNGSATLQASGTLAALNSALEGLTFQAPAVPPPSGIVTLTADINDQGASGSGGALGASGSIAISIDAPPTVTSTTPATGSTSADTVALSVTFSEPVDVAAGGITLACGGANLVTGGDSGNNVTTLAPTYAGTLPRGANCTLTVLASHVTDTDAIDPPDGMTVDYTATFQVDAEPQVHAVLPVNGAADVAADTAITVEFSESVDIGSATAFSLECPAGLPVGFTVTSPASLPASSDTYVLTPAGLLPQGSTCVFRVLASAISDTDSFDPPDTLAADFTSSFTIDQPPSVSLVSPADGAVVNTSPSLSVTFSEAVDLDADAFALACGSAVTVGSTPPLPASGVSSITFTPTVALPAGAACTATVFAHAVHDADSNDPPDTLAADHVWGFSVDAAPGVALSTPAPGAINVSPTSTLLLAFSEPVNFDTAAGAANTSFALVCDNVATGFTVASAAPSASVVLDPDDNAVAGRNCTLTVNAGAISDVDTLDPPDGLAADYGTTIGFGAMATDDTIATTPHLTVSTAQGAVNLAANDVLGTSGQILGYGLAPACSGTAAGTLLDAGSTNGRLTISASGEYSYEPPAGITNASRSFCYTVTGGDTAQVTFSLQDSPRLWFVDASASAGGIGTQARPFQTLSAAAAAQAINDTIFIATAGAPYPAGIALLNGVRLIGQGAAGTLSTHSGLTPVTGSTLPALGGTAPVLIASNSTAITLGSDNTVRGLVIGDTGTGSDLAGTDFGTLTLGEVVLEGSGRALNLDTGTVAGPGLDSLSVTSSASEGLRLNAVAGVLDLGSGSIAGTSAGANAVHLSGNTVTLTYSGSLAKATNGKLVDITGGSGNITLSGNLDCNGGCTGVSVASRSAGTVTFSGSTKTLSTGTTGPAVALSGNTGATVQFDGGGLQIATTSAAGFSATGGGIVSVTGTGNTIASAAGVALTVVDTTLGAAGLNFQSIAKNGAGNGIVLNNTGTLGGLTVTGTTTPGSGGTIRNGSIGVLLTNTRHVSLHRMQLNDFADYAILGTAVVDFVLDTCVVSGTNGNDAGAQEGSIRFSGLTGTATIRDSSISGAATNNVQVVNTAGTLDLTVNGTTFGAMNTGTGNDALLLETLNTAVINATVQNNTFAFAIGDHFQFAANGSATSDVVFSGNAISNTGVTAASGGGGVRITGGSNAGTATPGDDINASLTFDVIGNAMRDSRGTALAVNKLGGSGTFSGVIESNTVGVANVTDSGSSEGSSLYFLQDFGGTYTVALRNNSVRQYGNYGIYAQTGGSGIVGSGAINATITGNTASDPGTQVFSKNGAHLNGGVSAGDAYAICYDLGGTATLGNTLGGSGTDGGTDFRLRQRQNTTVRLPGYAGGATDTSAVVTFAQARNTGTETGAALTSGTGGGFVGGAACPLP